MITGFNTDVKHGTKVYHVQTEDKGRNNPKIETLVYVGGEILDNCRTSYEQSKADLSEEQIMELLENQHKRVIRSIKIGKYDEPASFPEDVMTDRPLEDVIVAYLESEPVEDSLKLVTNGIAGFTKARTSTLSFLATRTESHDSVSGVMIRIKLIQPGERTKVFFKGETDRNGALSADVHLPEVAPGEVTVMVQAVSEWGTYEQAFPLRRVAQ